MDLLSFSHSPLSLAAPVVAILLAIVTRKVLLSLGAGILTGALLLTGYSPLDSLAYIGKSFVAVSGMMVLMSAVFLFCCF